MSKSANRKKNGAPAPSASWIKILLSSSCVTYSVIVMLLCVILLFTGNASGVVSPLNFLLVFPFSICFSIANYVDRNTKLSTLLKTVIHFVLTVGGFFCFLYLPAFSGNSDSNSIVVFAVFAICYLIVYGVILLFRKRWSKEVHLDGAYTSQFSMQDSDKSTHRRK